MRAVEATRLALVADIPDPAQFEAAARAAVIYLYDRSPAAPASVALAALEAAGYPPGAVLIGKTVNAAERLGDVALQDQLLERALARDDFEDRYRAQFLGLRADRLVQLGELEDVRRIHENDELPVFEALGDKRSITITRGQIAKILHSQGELDAALEMPLERLPIGQERRDSGSLAHIRFFCAQIRLARRLRARWDPDNPQ